MKILYFLLIVLASGSILAPNDAMAATHKVTPRYIDRTVEPRDIFTEEITISSNAQYRLEIFPSINNIDVGETGDILEFIPRPMDQRDESASSWITISHAAIDLYPGATTSLPITVQVDSRAKPGEYHVLIGFGHGRNRPIAEAAVQDGSAPSIMMRLEVLDTKKEELRLDTFTVSRFVVDADNDSVSYTLENPGDKTVTPTGEVIFYNARGSEVGTAVVNPERLSIAPGEQASLKATVPTDGVMGKYKAFLVVDYGNNQLASVYDTAFFYLIPWQQLLAFLIGLAAFGTLFLYLLHRRYRGSAAEGVYNKIPFHIYEGNSPDLDHDINLKK